MQMAPKVQVEVGYDPATLNEIEKRANERDVSRAQYIREATRQELQAEEITNDE